MNILDIIQIPFNFLHEKQTIDQILACFDRDLENGNEIKVANVLGDFYTMHHDLNAVQKNKLFKILEKLVISIISSHQIYYQQKIMHLFLQYVTFYINDISNNNIHDVFIKLFDNKIKIRINMQTYKYVDANNDKGTNYFLAEMLYSEEFIQNMEHYIRSKTIGVQNRTVIEYILSESFKLYNKETKTQIASIYLDKIDSISKVESEFENFYYTLARYNKKFFSQYINYQKMITGILIKSSDFESIFHYIRELVESQNVSDEEISIYGEIIYDIILLYTPIKNDEEKQKYREKILKGFIDLLISKKLINIEQVKSGLIINKKPIRLFEKLFLGAFNEDKFIEFFDALKEFTPSVSATFLKVLETVNFSSVNKLQSSFDTIVSHMDYEVSMLLFRTATRTRNPDIRKIIRNSIIKLINDYNEEVLNIFPLFLACNLYEFLRITPKEADIERVIYETLPSYYILPNLSTLGKNYKILHQKDLIRYVPPSTQLFNYLKTHSDNYDDIMDWILDQNSQSKQFFELLLKIYEKRKDPDLLWKILPLSILIEEQEYEFLMPVLEMMSENPNILVEKMKNENAHLLATRFVLFDLSEIDMNLIAESIKSSPFLLVLAHECPNKIHFDYSKIESLDTIEKAFYLDSALENADDEFWNNFDVDNSLPDIDAYDKDHLPIAAVLCKIYIDCYKKKDMIPDVNFTNKSFLIGIKSMGTQLCESVIDYINDASELIEEAFKHTEEYFASILMKAFNKKEDFVMALKFSSNKTITVLIDDIDNLTDEDWIRKLPYVENDEKYEEVFRIILNKIQQTKENYLLIFDQLFSTNFTRYDRKNAAKIIFDVLPDAQWFNEYLNDKEFYSYSIDHPMTSSKEINSKFLSALYVLSCFPFVINKLDDSPLSKVLLDLRLSPSTVNIDFNDPRFYNIYNSDDFEKILISLIANLPNHTGFMFGQEIALDSLTYNERNLSKEQIFFFDLIYNQNLETSINMMHQTYKRIRAYSAAADDYILSGTSAKYTIAPNVIAYKIADKSVGGINVPSSLVNRYCTENTEYILSSFVAEYIPPENYQFFAYSSLIQYATYIPYNKSGMKMLLRITPNSCKIVPTTNPYDHVRYIFYLKKELFEEKVTKNIENNHNMINASISLILNEEVIDWLKILNLPSSEQLAIQLLLKFKFPILFDQFLNRSNEFVNKTVLEILKSDDAEKQHILCDMLNNERMKKLKFTGEDYVSILTNINQNKNIASIVFDLAMKSPNNEQILDSMIEKNINWDYLMKLDIKENAARIIRNRIQDPNVYYEIEQKMRSSNKFLSNIQKIYDPQTKDYEELKFINSLVLMYTERLSKSNYETFVSLSKIYSNVLTESKIPITFIDKYAKMSNLSSSEAKKLCDAIDYLPVPHDYMKNYFDKITKTTSQYTNLGILLFRYLQRDITVANYFNQGIIYRINACIGTEFLYFSFHPILEEVKQFFGELTPEKLSTVELDFNNFLPKDMFSEIRLSYYIPALQRLFNKDWARKSNIMEYFATLLVFDPTKTNTSIEALRILNTEPREYIFRIGKPTTLKPANIMKLKQYLTENMHYVFQQHSQAFSYYSLLAAYHIENTEFCNRLLKEMTGNKKLATAEPMADIKLFFLKYIENLCKKNYPIDNILMVVAGWIEYLFITYPSNFVDNFYPLFDVLSNEITCKAIRKNNLTCLSYLDLDFISSISPCCSEQAIKSFGALKANCNDFMPLCFKFDSFVNILITAASYKEDTVLLLMNYFQAEIKLKIEVLLANNYPENVFTKLLELADI